jgi:aspartate carbamoyltransferase catalytic subunit
MIPREIESIGVEVTYSIEAAVREADVIMMLRIQKERMEDFLFPSDREYGRFFGLTHEAVSKAKKNVLIMHPGPINRGVEIPPEIADGAHSVILDQVENGVAVRMALLYILSGGPRHASDN